MALTIGGYHVIACEDGIEALRFIEGDEPAAIVLDLGLPRLSGRDVQRELASHAETRHIPIIVVTGDTRALNEEDFACVLRKPVSPEGLLSAVEACLRERGLRPRRGGAPA